MTDPHQIWHSPPPPEVLCLPRPIANVKWEGGGIFE